MDNNKNTTFSLIPADSRILVVLPHPDDEAFSLSGTLAKHIAQGGQVTYACLTLGEMGRNMGIPPFTNRIGLPTIRKGELEKSAQAIGIQDLRMLGFHDKTIEFEVKEVLDGTIYDLIVELKPSLIVTFSPGYSVHPDHDATGAAVVRAVERLPQGERPLLHTMAFSKNCYAELGQPDIENDVSDFLENKMKSIQAHRSQFQAVEMLGQNKLKDKEIKERFGKERFWTHSV